MPRMMRTASSSQRSRSPGECPNSTPKAVCSVSNHAPPIPRIARPFDMWSRVVAIFATSAGLRNVLAPTIRPMRACCVASAQAARLSQPSNMGPSGDPTMGYRWSQVQRSSYPSRSAVTAASRNAGQWAYWFQHSAPNLMASAMPDHLLDLEADGEPLLAVELVRVVSVTHREGPDVIKSALAVVVELDAPVHRDPGQLVLEAEAGARIAAQVVRLGPPLLGVHQDGVRVLEVKVEPHHRLAGRPLVGQHRQDRVAKLLGQPRAQLIGQGLFNGQCRIGHGAPPWTCILDRCGRRPAGAAPQLGRAA